MKTQVTSAISAREADAAFAGLEAFDRVVLAVSGGPDSMALMVLAAEWRARMPSDAPLLSVATVDHGLRPESHAEAELVAEEARRLGLAHTTIPWNGEKPSTGLPAAARDARYRLLTDHAGTLGGGRMAIVTAHHRDDQAETFAMRLARGAGIDGLAGMRSERPVHGGLPIMLVRPLLAFSKERLVATLAARGIAYAEDTTNSDRRYERARVRSLASRFAGVGLSADAIATSARRLGEARDALSYAERCFVASLDISFGNEVFARLDRKAFEAGPIFLRQKIIARLIARYGGASPSPQLCEVEDLVARMQREGASAATLGGAMISTGSRFIRVWREVGRLDPAEVTLTPGVAQVWDGRFVVRWAGHAARYSGRHNSNSVIVKPLGKGGYASIVGSLAPGHRPPTRASLAVPAFWTGGRLLAAPSLAPFAQLDGPPLDPGGYELAALADNAAF
ncbi:MAG: tRNA lysidine(34) synthetase TilS [Hyphomicrobium sp.]